MEICPNTDQFRIDHLVFHPPASKLHQSSDYLVKIITGVPGDIITHADNSVYVNKILIGTIQPHSSTDLTLHPGFTGIIPKDYYFVSTPHPRSFDSRYREVGLVHYLQIIGRVRVLW